MFGFTWDEKWFENLGQNAIFWKLFFSLWAKEFGVSLTFDKKLETWILSIEIGFWEAGTVNEAVV